jgi:microcystin-dependent protein
MSFLVGEIRTLAAEYVPPGFLPCDGSLVSVATYSELFRRVGTRWGGNGTSTFGLPPFNDGRVLVGIKESDVDLNAVGKLGGAKTTTLNEANLPPHFHVGGVHAHGLNSHTHSTVIGTNSSPDILLAAPGTASGWGFKFLPTSAPSPGNTADGGQINTSTVGNGIPISNMPPFGVVFYVICYTERSVTEL